MGGASSRHARCPTNYHPSTEAQVEQPTIGQRRGCRDWLARPVPRRLIQVRRDLGSNIRGHPFLLRYRIFGRPLEDHKIKTCSGRPVALGSCVFKRRHSRHTTHCSYEPEKGLYAIIGSRATIKKVARGEAWTWASLRVPGAGPFQQYLSSTIRRSRKPLNTPEPLNTRQSMQYALKHPPQRTARIRLTMNMSLETASAHPSAVLGVRGESHRFHRHQTQLRQGKKPYNCVTALPPIYHAMAPGSNLPAGKEGCRLYYDAERQLG